jgi:hypothetical protein
VANQELPSGESGNASARDKRGHCVAEICRSFASNTQWCMKIASKTMIGNGIPISQSNNPRPKPMAVSPQQIWMLAK